VGKGGIQEPRESLDAYTNGRGGKRYFADDACMRLEKEKGKGVLATL